MNRKGRWVEASRFSYRRPAGVAGKLSAAGLVLLCMATLGATQAHAASYNVLDLGALGGAWPWASARAINNADQVAGQC
jgi:hypothetical protein